MNGAMSVKGWSMMATTVLLVACAADADPATSSSSGGAAAGGNGTVGGAGGSGASNSNVGGGGAGGNGSGGNGSGGGSAGGEGTAAGLAEIEIESFSLVDCGASTSAALLEAKSDGLTVPKPAQSYAGGTLSIEYTVSGQFGQVGIDFEDVDMEGCGISVMVKAASSPTCGVYAVPFFYDQEEGLIAPYDAVGERFVGEEVSGLAETATITFAPEQVTLGAVARVGVNFYNCPASVTAGDL